MTVSEANSLILLADLDNPEAARRSLETAAEALRTRSPAELVSAVLASGLRGRGGAGFPAGIKWQAVAGAQAEQKFLVVNGAEGEPGSYKDRFLMKRLPHRVVAGSILAAYAVGATKGYIYIHHEADDCRAAIEGALEEARALGLLGEDVLGTGFSLDLQTHPAGIGYVAGEETAVIRVLEGGVAKPKPKPPYPTVRGLWGFPTLVNNVETIANVEPIVRNGPQWYRRFGTADTPGTILVTLHGVKKPGVYEVEAGTPLSAVINEHGGGARGRILAVLPGGYASGFLSPEELDVPLEHASLRARGSALGSATIHVFDESQCIVEVTRKVLRFFAAETCGQCFPCRRGTRDLYQLLDEAESGSAREDWDGAVDAILQLTGRKTICGLDKASSLVFRSAYQRFASEFRDHLSSNACRVCSSGAGGQ